MMPKKHEISPFPSCVSLSITFNDHATMYQSVEEFVEHTDMDWASDSDKELAIRSDSVWVAHWYPDTPVGSYCLAASSFERLMDALRAWKE